MRIAVAVGAITLTAASAHAASLTAAQLETARQVCYADTAVQYCSDTSYPLAWSPEAQDSVDAIEGSADGDITTACAHGGKQFEAIAGIQDDGKPASASRLVAACMGVDASQSMIVKAK
ncbi:hypothetical protein DPM33_23630 [Mesorhizobium hawassense]|uniref:Secreted protein n=1 Tax=Mesorhizobium hawassense TaxID=1209954 RepID=A0A330HPC2_9HYPH|nr:hypothetical protein DPM33_23630 [Mesorhizobium hawassense]